MAKTILNGNLVFGNIHLGEGGASDHNVEKVLEDGQISTTSSYATASFSDISGYEYVLIRFRDTVSSVDYVDYRYVKVSDIGNGVTLYPTLHRAITVLLTTTTIGSTNYSGSYYNIYADIVGLDEDIFELDYIRPIPISSVRAPELLSAQSANKNNLVSLSYTFTSAGTYQYYVMDRTRLDDHYEFMTTVKLNGIEITSSQYIDLASGDAGFKYGEITVNANDVLTVTTTKILPNYCVNLWIFRYADINSFRYIGSRGNDGSTFTINSSGVVFAEAYHCGYYNGNNNFNYLVGVGYNGLESIPTPNTSEYYYGFTYVFSLTGGNS